MNDVVENFVVSMKEDMVVYMEDFVSSRQIPIDLVDAVNGVWEECQIKDLGGVNPHHANGRCGGWYRIWEVRVEMRPFHYDLTLVYVIGVGHRYSVGGTDAGVEDLDITQG
eukprot:scaffold23188_cov42-Cyclotella_meneghiniana.AAC.7